MVKGRSHGIEFILVTIINMIKEQTYQHVDAFNTQIPFIHIGSDLVIGFTMFSKMLRPTIYNLTRGRANGLGGNTVPTGMHLSEQYSWYSDR